MQNQISLLCFAEKNLTSQQRETIWRAWPRRCFAGAGDGSRAIIVGKASGKADAVLAPNQNTENNPMHSSHGCRRDIYGFSEIG